MDAFVGYCTAELRDEEGGVMFPMAVVYPTLFPGKTEQLGPYSLDVTKDAPIKEGIYPLVLISHGSGGSNLVYRTLARYLASNGFIVGMVEHPFNNRNNNTLAGTAVNLVNRPRHIRTAINWFFNSDQFAPFLKPNCVSLIGHSMGGYTALAIAGGIPTSFPKESVDKQSREISVSHDPRIKAIVLLAPAAVWFKNEGALSGVKCPILLLVGDKDEYTGPLCPLVKSSDNKEHYMQYGYHAQLILDGVPDNTKIQHRVVKNAGHFCFLSPFPEAMTRVTFAPSQDPLGFDREAFHREYYAEVLAFLLREAS